MGDSGVQVEERPDIASIGRVDGPSSVHLGEVAARVEPRSEKEGMIAQLGDRIKAKFERYHAKSELREKIWTEPADDNLEGIDLNSQVGASFQRGDRSYNSSTKVVIARSKTEGDGNTQWHFHKTAHNDYYHDRAGRYFAGQKIDEHLQMVDGVLTYIRGSSDRGVYDDPEIIPYTDDTPPEEKARVEKFLDEALKSF